MGREMTLTPEVAEVAARDLNELPEEREEKLEELRKLVKANPELTCSIDDSFLLRFLRARKFEVSRAYSLVTAYCEVRRHEKDALRRLVPSAMTLQMEVGMDSVLQHTDTEGRRVLYFRPGRWNPQEMTVVDIFRFCLLNAENLIREESTQVLGVVMIGDLRNVSLSHARHMTYWYHRRMSSLIQDSFPMRFKGVHFVNEPAIFGHVFSLIKPFLKDKMKKRVRFHGTNFTSLHEHVDPDILPADLGGSRPEFSPQWWNDELVESQDYFAEQEKHFLNAPQVLKLDNGADASLGLQGTFKKLQID